MAERPATVYRRWLDDGIDRCEWSEVLDISDDDADMRRVHVARLARAAQVAGGRPRVTFSASACVLLPGRRIVFEVEP